MAAREQFSSRFGFVMAAAGSAVGLGNIWGFPTQAASNGGAAFLIVYLVLAFMGYAGVSLDAGTLLIGGVIIGLAVDDTIHFMHRFGRYYDESQDVHYAVHETLATTGTALLFTSLVLASGFAVFLLSYMQNTYWFGALCLLGTGVAFAADVLLAPALMVLVTRRERTLAAREVAAGH